MIRDASFSAALMGLIVAIVGFASSFAIVLAGLKAMGAIEAQAASGLMASAVAMGVGAILVSLRLKTPVSWAWTTPGAALMATSAMPSGGFPEAVGAFIVAAGLIVCAGLFRPFGRAVEAIPVSLANALLAGILLTLCLAPFKAVAYDPWLGLPIIIAWLIGGRLHKLAAVPSALLAFIAVVVFGVTLPPDAGAIFSASALPAPILVWPEFTLASAVGLGLPLFLVTMASQNIPGFAVLKANDYAAAVPARPTIAATGVFSAVSAVLGGISVNLAAITAAMCMGEDAHPDRDRRYWSAVFAGVFYICFGLLAGVATAFLSLAPGVLIEAVAGLALIGTFAGAARAAFDAPQDREAAAITFLITASGLSFFGISGAFWGLLAGVVVYAVTRRG